MEVDAFGMFGILGCGVGVAEIAEEVELDLFGFVEGVF
jgi:hypothetical protein